MCMFKNVIHNLIDFVSNVLDDIADSVLQLHRLVFNMFDDATD